MKKGPLEALAPRRAVVAALVFLLAMGVTLLAYHLTKFTIENTARREFQQHVERVESAIRDRMLGYEQVLRSGAGLFAAASNVNRQDWRRYVSNMRIKEIYPGVRGLHIALRVPAHEVDTHLAAIRAEGFPKYEIRPEGTRPEYYPVTWPEPFDERNQRVMGFDMFSEPIRRDAMSRARDSGKSAITGKVKLAGETKDPVPGFLYYYPIYANNLPVGNATERQAAIAGFVFCPFRMPDLMAGTLGKEADFLHVEIYDGLAPSKENWLHNDDDKFRALQPGSDEKYALKRQLKFGGHTWSAHFEASPEFVGTIDRMTPRVLLAVGMVMSLLATALTFRVLTAEAVAQAASMHDGLTGLYNRRYLEASLKREEVRARRIGSTISIIQFDLDHFKKFNDSYGHAAGDLVLRMVAEVLRKETRGDDIACRYGGEEFTVIMPGASLGTATSRAEALREKVGRLVFQYDGKQLPGITISGGVAVFPDHAETLEAVLNKADAALILAKREGRARIKVAEASTTLG